MLLGALVAALGALIALRRMQARVDESDRLVTVTARAGVLMARTLNALETLPDVVRVLVPDGADWAAIHLVEGHGGVIRAGVAHRDPAIQSEIEHLQRLFTFNTKIPFGPAHVLRTGESSFAPHMSPEIMERVAAQY